MKVGENLFYTMMARHLELATKVVLEPMFPFSGRIEKFKDAGYFHDISMSWSLDILARHLELATEVVLEPTSPFISLVEFLLKRPASTRNNSIYSI